eukprot:c6089_g1_i5.p1 GENE.c6089_g1_i5~~c6089_g1_i5.p1  ORF type:complete len:131 (-),score=18.68 c6089_g1_i5:195-587(-)
MTFRFRMFQTARVVVDLGAGQGGWTQVAIERMKQHTPSPHVIAIDYRESNLKMDFVTTIVADIFNQDQVVTSIEHLLNGEQVDVVLSDLAPNVSGDRFRDHTSQMVLALVFIRVPRIVVTGETESRTGCC